MNELRSLSWLMMGSTGSTPGMLRLAQGVLTFEAHGRGALTGGQLRELAQRSGVQGLEGQLDAGLPGIVFSAALPEIGKVTFPWYYFGGGMKLAVRGVPYRFSFLQPQNTRVPGDIRGLGDIPGGRAAGKAWKAALAG